MIKHCYFVCLCSKCALLLFIYYFIIIILFYFLCRTWLDFHQDVFAFHSLPCERIRVSNDGSSNIIWKCLCTHNSPGLVLHLASPHPPAAQYPGSLHKAAGMIPGKLLFGEKKKKRKKRKDGVIFWPSSLSC